MGPTPDPRPPKRTRLSPDGPPHAPPPPPTPPTPPPSHVKHERSPSPSPVNPRRLITCGARRFAPIPDDCLPSCTEYIQNRSRWIAGCVEELEALNLVAERRIVRDDGLIVDWKSHVPVWSDTLKPDPLDLAATIMLTHRSNAQRRRNPARNESPKKSVTALSAQSRPASSPRSLGNSSDAEPPLQKRLPMPPRPSPKQRRSDPSQPVPISSPSRRQGSSPPRPERPRLPDETEHRTTSHSPSRDPALSLADHVPIPSNDVSAQHDQVSVSREPPGALDRSIAPCSSSAAEEAMSEMTLNYIRRYVQTYEADRASLASAYARNASFAYRVHQVVRHAGIASPQRSSSGPKRARLDIVAALLTLPCLHSNAQSSATARVEYDIFYLGAELGMFVVCRVAVSTKTVVHNFVLQRREVDAEDRAIESVWPLTASVHQILVFQA